MSTEHTGGGDPRRTIELLWGVPDRPRRGPKPKLAVADVVTAAIALADGDSLESLSIRRVAEQLGVAPMSVYTYVPSRAELLDLMMDRVYGELTDPPADTDWRAALGAIAEANWALYHRHPWMLQVTTSRPTLGPNTMAKYERELRAADGLGLTDLELDGVVSLVNGFVQGAARGSVDAARLVHRSGMTDDQWWAASAPALAEVADFSRFPLGSRVGTAAGEAHGSAYDPQFGFHFGLTRLLDGVEQLIATRRPH